MNHLSVSVCITNLGMYNEGVIKYKWLNLPATDEEIAEALDAIHVCHDDVTYENCFGCPYEELFLSDWECSMENLIDGYTPLRVLNKIVNKLDALDDEQLEVIDAMLRDGYDIDDAMQIII